MALALLVLLLVLITAFAVAFLIMRNAGRLGVIQTPNERSSHVRPTPGGGGVGIVAGSAIAIGWAAFTTPVTALGLLAFGVLIAAIGFYDDRKALSARFRFMAQIVLTGAAIGFCVPLQPLAVAIGLPLPALVIAAVALMVAVYWINIFNFMDGIDGIASMQAIFMLLSGAALATIKADATSDPLFWMLCGVAAATLGFLLLNWPPARIFMGDAGSTFLGFVIALLALLTIAKGWLNLAQWAILAALFVTDATVTLTRRLLLRERVFEAHKRHAYQYLSRRWHGHLPVTLAYLALNAIWLLPLAHLAALPGWALWAVVFAYVPLLIAALWAGAGAPEQHRPV